MGLRQTRLLEADEKNDRSDRGRREYEAWRDARAATLAAGAVATMRVATATELAAAKPPPDLPEAQAIVIEEAVRAPGRPHGDRFGTLVHATLARVRLEAGRAEVAAIAAFFARSLGAGDEETAAAIEAAIGALASPLMRRAAAATDVRREAALAVILDDGTVAEGVADLVFTETHGAERLCTVVDFKTDREIASLLDEYRAQIALYVRAVQRATGAATRGVILWI
jgi:ATP-dependent exoDNAse (exonuclease V) beta subunit